MQRQIIPIIFATNNGYAPYAGVSIESLIKNSSKDYFYDITVFHTDLNEDNKALFLSMQGENYSVKPLCVTRFIEKELKLMYTNFHFSKEMFYRILIPSVFENYNKAIYLDCDTVVLGDIAELYETDLEGNVIAAANDIMHTRAKEYVIKDLGMDVKKYINSGVLVIDCEKFREQKIKEKFFAELAVRSSLKYPDQDLINIVCANNIKYLPRKWNYIWHYHTIKSDPTLNLPEEELEQYLKDAEDIGLLHFTSAVKPWNNRTLALSKHFWKYVPGCAFEKQIVNYYKKIPMKRYIGYHFIDEGTDSYVITASLYAIDDTKLEDVVVAVDGQEIESVFYYQHVIEIDRRVYNRVFFKFFIPFNKITGKRNITFYERKSGDRLPSIFSATFPLDSSLRSFSTFSNAVFYNFKGDVFFGPAKKEIVEEKELFFKKDLELRKKNPKYKKSNLLRKIYHILKPFVKKEIWLISDRMDSAGDNGQAFFEYICNNTPQKVKPYFVINKDSKDYKKIKKIGNVVDPRSRKIKILYLFCTRNISAHFEKETLHPIYNYTQLKDILSKCKNVFLQHGIIKDDLSLVYNRSLFDFDIFVTSAKGEYESIAYNPAYGCDETVTKLTGLPRYDKLSDNREKLLVFLPTWRKYCFADSKQNQLISNVKETQYVKFYNALLHDERLLAAAKQNGYKLCYYPHPLMKKTDCHIKPLDRDLFVSSDAYTYSDIFSKASLLFTDFSSCQFDFAYLRKPVVYCHFDKTEFFSSHTYREGYFNYERDGFGEVVYDLESSVDLLIDYMKKNCTVSDLYMERINNFFTYDDKDNCKRVLGEILKLK